ncbi:hypothetical protein JB92DRAFT_3048096 [Gautieria morchelliformis]|nr:hypothetical protein JB92DRAFT_3048096 [Gautieria morchelliformis]
MALDKNLFTLNLEASKIEPSAIDLVDPSGTVHYRKQWVPNDAGTYLFSLSEPLSESILATVSAPAATTKEKLIELHNPSAAVRLTFKGTLTFKWVFTWEQHNFEWKREACYMIRKPDPPVLVAVTKEPAGKIKTSTVQILDYNLNRFDIEDRKGLEIVLLAGLLTFGDYSEQMRAKPSEATQSPANVPPVAAPPSPPPKPDGWKEDQIAILQAKEQRDVNEVVIGEQGGVDEYVQHCVSLLKDDTLLFITLRSLAPSCVSKVVQVAEATKRQQYKDSGYDDDQELHQYVGMSFDEDAGKGKGKGKDKGKKGPRVINLDDNPTAPRTPLYQPPNTLTIHLSKIAMPELEPKTNNPKNSKPGANSSGRQGRAAPEPEVSKTSKTSKQERRQSSAAAMATLAPPPQATAPSPNGLRAKLSALTLQPTSPPVESRTPSESSSRRQSPPQSRSPLVPPQAPRPGRSPQPPKQHHSKIPSDPLQQPRRPPTQQQRPPPPVGTGPQLNSQPPTFRPPQQTPIYPLRPASAGNAIPYPGPGPMNAPPTNPAYGMYLRYPGAPPPQPPAPQRASGKGFFSRR